MTAQTWSREPSPARPALPARPEPLILTPLERDLREIARLLGEQIVPAVEVLIASRPGSDRLGKVRASLDHVGGELAAAYTALSMAEEDALAAEKTAILAAITQIAAVPAGYDSDPVVATWAGVA